ncbi:MAG: exodeoxyribonuclease V subunit gamma, partial [Burkholderiaceae bacterium]
MSLEEVDAMTGGLKQGAVVVGRVGLVDKADVVASLPSQSLEVLRGISTFTQVLLCVHNPCQFNWADVVSAQDLARRTATRHARKPGLPLQLSDEDLHLQAHPLLASWGKQGRDYIRFVDEADTPDDYRPLFQAAGHRIDLFEAHADSGPG